MDPLTGAIVALVLWVVVGMGIAPPIVYAIFSFIGVSSDREGGFAAGIIIGWILASAVETFSLIEAIIALIHLIQVASGGH